MISAKELFDLLPNFFKTGEIYKQFIGNDEASELPSITNINHINTGALYNILEWHLRYKKLAVKSSALEESSTMFLDVWGRTLNITRPAGYTDEQYIGFIIAEILSTPITSPWVVNAFPDEYVYHCQEMGFYSDFSVSDVGVLNPTLPNRIASSIVTHERNSVYIYSDDFLTLNPVTLSVANKRKAGGTGIYIGEY
jgi:hypothetical protein